MLVLRKEMKLGLGIGAAVLGIAGVYGLMAVMSANSRTPGQPSPADTSAQVQPDPVQIADASHPTAISGLPPKDDKVASDPFLESARNDGNKSDPWTQALNTGKVPTETGLVSAPAPRSDTNSGQVTAMKTNDIVGPIVTQAPTDATLVSGPPRSTGDKTSAHAATDKPATGGTYMVAPGDTFTRIAVKLYGDRRLAAALIKANPNIEPTRLRSGVAIVVPAKEELSSLRGSVAPTASPLTGTLDASREYRVVSGDTLHRIATKLYGRNAMWEAIYDANKSVIGSDPAKLKIGEVLKLPKPPTAAS